MDEPPRLTTIPVELLASIAECVNGQDLLSLRLVGKEVSAGIDSVFLKAFFAEPQAHLVQRIDHVTFVVVERSEYLTTPSRWAPTIEHNKRVDSLNAALERWEREQSEFQQNSATNLLTQTFKSLARSGKSLSLAVTDSEGDLPVYGSANLTSGYEWAEEITRGRGPVFQFGPCDDAIEIIFEALSRSEATMKHIDLCHQSVHYGVKDNLPLPPSSSQIQLMPIWQALTVLKIGFLNETDYYPRGSGYGEGVIWMLRCMVSLRELELRNTFEPAWTEHDFGDSNAIRQIGSAVPAGHLRRLALGGLHAKQEHFVSFFSRHGDTLEGLSLEDVSVPHAQDWGTVIAHTEQNMHLQRLQICRLYRGNDPDDSVCVLKDAQQQLRFAWHCNATIVAGLMALRQLHNF